MHILFADDETDTHDLFQHVFAANGHTTQVVTNGEEVMGEISREQYDAIVLDVAMPVMNGWDTLFFIRQSPKGAQVPVIIFTGSAEPDLAREAYDAGADLVVVKPILPAQLLDMITKAVAKRQGTEVPS